jgi:hypothetical protein
MAKRTRASSAGTRKSSAAKRHVKNQPLRDKQGRFRPATKRETIARKRALAAKPASPAKPVRTTRVKSKARARGPSYAKRFATFGGGGALRSEARLREIEAGLQVMKEKGVEWIRSSGAPAVQPTMLRHVPEAYDLIRNLERVAGLTGNQFTRTLHQFAAHRGIDVKSAYKLLKQSYEGPFSPGFRRVARQIAQRYGLALREVYTLWFSP